MIIRMKTAHNKRSRAGQNSAAFHLWLNATSLTPLHSAAHCERYVLKIKFNQRENNGKDNYHILECSVTGKQ